MADTELPRVFLTRRLPPENMARLEAETDLRLIDLDRELARYELLEGVRDADGLICLLGDRIDAEVMDAGQDLKVISNYAVGFNNIDVSAADERNIAVTNTPGVLTDCTADMAWALLMSAARRVVEGDQMTRAGRWEGWEPLQLLGTKVTGATIGIVGFGRIGQAVARRASAFDMRILYWNRTRLAPADEQKLGVQYAELSEVLPQCDFVSLHVALNDDTRHLISTEQFERMKSTSVLINTARGAVVDERALVTALAEGQIGAAALDVYENEPALERELRELPNTVLAPHLGSATLTTRTEMGELAINNCLAACRGERPPHLVNSSWNPE